MSDPPQPVVVVAADDADRYESWLAPDYEVRTADSAAALEDCADGAVDVVLVTRALAADGDPLAAVREAAPRVRVAALVDEDPSFDVIESGFDAVVRTPVDRDGLVAAVEDLLGAHEFAERVVELGELVAEEAPPSADADPVEDDVATAVAAAEPDVGDEVGTVDDELAAERDRLTDDAAFVGTLREVAGEEGEIDEDPDAGGETGE